MFFSSNSVVLNYHETLPTYVKNHVEVVDLTTFVNCT